MIPTTFGSVRGIKALEDCADKQRTKFILVTAHLIPQHFKVEHEHKLSMLFDAATAEARG